MKKLVLIFSILLLANGVHPFILSLLTNIQGMVNLATDLSDLVMGRHDLTAGKLFKKKVDPTLEKVTQLSEKIEELTKTMNVKMDNLMTAVLTDVPRMMKFANLMRKFIEYVTRIDELYEDYQYYVHQKRKFNRYTIEDFSKVMTSHRFGDLQDILKQIYHIFIPGQLDQREESLLDAMVATLKAITEPERCGMIKSTQQQLYDLYETVILSEIKGFVMSTYSFGLLTIYENSTFENEVYKLRNQLVLRCSQYLSSIDKALVGLSRDFFNCDPPKHVNGETYVALRGEKIKTIIMRPQISDIKNNMVVTGVKFELNNHIIHIQIEEGKLLSGGQIDRDSIHMKKLDVFKYLMLYRNMYELVSDDEGMILEVYRDYIFFTNNRRYINLDNVFSREPGYVVTGLKLSIDPEKFESLQLAVHITPFDFDSGLLTPNDTKPSKWITYKHMSDEDRKFENRIKIDAAIKDTPTNYYGHVPSSEDFSVTWFGPPQRFLNHGGNAFPFFDSQLVAPQPRIPLEGVSLYYRGTENSAGFLGFRMTTLNIPTYLNPQMSQQDLEFFSHTYENEILNNPPEEIH